MLKNKVKSIFLSLNKESLSSEYIALLTNTPIKKIEKILIQLENENYIR
jgi:hypothetical protein